MAEALKKPDLVTPEEAANVLRVHRVTMRRHLREGVVPGIKIGSRWFVSTAVLDELRAGRNPTADRL